MCGPRAGKSTWIHPGGVRWPSHSPRLPVPARQPGAADPSCRPGRAVLAARDRQAGAAGHRALLGSDGRARRPAPRRSVHVDCAAPGKGRWADTRNWVYDFDADLSAGLRCTFTLKAGLTALRRAPDHRRALVRVRHGRPRDRRLVPARRLGGDRRRSGVPAQARCARGAGVDRRARLLRDRRHRRARARRGARRRGAPRTARCSARARLRLFPAALEERRRVGPCACAIARSSRRKSWSWR